MDEDNIQELVTVPSDDLTYLKSVAPQYAVRVQEVPSRQILEYASMVSCLLAGSSIAVTRVMHLLDERNGGQVIDLRPEAHKPVYRSRDVQYGLIVILGDDGSVLVRHNNLRRDLESLLSALPNSAKKSASIHASDILKAIRQEIESESEVSILHNGLES